MSALPPPSRPPSRSPAARASTRWLGVARWSAAAVTGALGVLTLPAVARGWPAADPLGWLAVTGSSPPPLLGFAHQRAQHRRT